MEILRYNIFTVVYLTCLMCNTLAYVLRTTWVRNYIKFEYTFDNGANGIVRAIGCVPSNTKDGAMIKIGEKFNENELQYLCGKNDDDIVSYEAIACISPNGDIMKIGESKMLRNGTILLSCQMSGGVIKKIIQQLSGCLHNGTLYDESQRWIEPLRNDSCTAESPMTGVLMECFRPHYSYFEAQVAGCVAGNVSIPVRSYGILGDRFVHCEEQNGRGIELVWVEKSEITCELDGKKFEHNETWFDEERAARLQCKFKDVYKLECVLHGETIAIGEIVDLNNGCSFSCHPQSNVYICAKKIGDFTVIEKDENEQNNSVELNHLKIRAGDGGYFRG